MRLFANAFSIALATTAMIGATALQAQPGTSYDPPPVDYADAPSSPLPASGVVAADAAPPADAPRGRGRTRARVDVSAYVEAQAAISAELSGGSSGGDDVLTYTSVAAGVQGQVTTRRVQAAGGYRYERRIGLNDDVPDEDVHSGIAQVHADLVPGALALDAGALATRTGGNGRAAGVTARENGTEVYSGYVGPSVSTRVGPVAVNASYRLGYVHVDDDSLTGAGAADQVEDSTVHSASASVGVAPGDVAPVGVTVGAGYVRDDSGALNNRFEGRFVRADVVAPIGPTVAVTAGIGYSHIEASQSDVARGPGGAPIRDARGRFIADAGRPRVSTLDSDGIIYDAGVIWRPNPRTEVQARAGANEDGDLTVVGSAAIQFNRGYGATLSVFDQRTTFGQSLVNNLRSLPTDLQIDRNPITGDFFGGCVFGSEAGRGACLSPALQSLTNASFRARGASLVFSGGRRDWSFGAGATYTHRSFYLPDDPLFANAFASDDQDVALFATVSRRVGRDASLSLTSSANWYDSNLSADGSIFSGALNASFSRAFLLDQLQLIIALGVNYTSLLDADSTVANALIGVRYQF